MKKEAQMKITLSEIQEKLEASNDFKYWNNELGITFEDFEVIDLQSNKIIKQGKKDIGSYSILVKEDNLLSVLYDLTVDSLRDKRLQRIDK